MSLSISVNAQVRPTAEDVASLQQASAPQLSPDGNSLVYVLTKHEKDTKGKPSDSDKSGGWKTDRQLYLVDAAGGVARQLTFREEEPGAPAWSPDSRSIAFLRGKKLQVLSLDGGEARPIATGEYEPKAPAFSPDGKSIAFIASEPLSAEEKQRRWRRGGAKVFEGEWRNAQLFVVPAAGGEPRRVTVPPPAGTPDSRWKGSHVCAFEWSPEGTRFAVLVAESADPLSAYSLRVPQIIAAADGAIIRTLEARPCAIGTFRWSPDGRYLAYEKGEQTLSLLNVLAVHAVDGGESWNAAGKLDPTLSGFAWSGDSRSLIAHALERTTSQFYRLAINGSESKPLPFADRVVTTQIVADRTGRRFSFNSTTPVEPPSPTVLDVETAAARVAAPLNRHVSNWALGRAEVVRWRSPEGVELEGVLTATQAAPPGLSPPLIVMPHGGPDSVTSNDFNSRAHYFAAHGYSVFRPNYRGGFGYGHKLYAANRDRLGEIEFMDIESGVDALIKTGKADPARLIYGGWSWGGYLTAWTIGHTDRYRAAVVGAGVVDTVLQYVTSDINHGVAAEWEYKGNPWHQPENFARANPLHSLAKIRTPTLIIHGERDDRVALPHAIILYRALHDVGTTVRLLTYPDEPHGFKNPAHTAHMLDEWLAWYRKHVPSGVDSRTAQTHSPATAGN